MEILEDHDLAKYLFDKYSTNQRKWNFIISTSSVKGAFFDAIVSNPDEVWQLKIDSIYKPNPLVMGTKTTTESSINENNRETENQVRYRQSASNVLKNLRTSPQEENNNAINL